MAVLWSRNLKPRSHWTDNWLLVARCDTGWSQSEIPENNGNWFGQPRWPSQRCRWLWAPPQRFKWLWAPPQGSDDSGHQSLWGGVGLRSEEQSAWCGGLDLKYPTSHAGIFRWPACIFFSNRPTSYTNWIESNGQNKEVALCHCSQTYILRTSHYTIELLIAPQQGPIVTLSTTK